MDVVKTVRSVIGTRRTISRALMAQAMELLAKHGLSLENGYVPDTGGQAPKAARQWANACKSSTCICVSADGLRDGWVHYDEPGSMHPMQRSDVIFVPQHAARDSLDYLRQRAKRVVVVTDDAPLIDPPGEGIAAKLRDWQQERNTCPEELIHSVDSRHAHRLGLVTLSEIESLLDRIEKQAPLKPVGGMDVHLKRLSRIARGEAQQHLCSVAGDQMLEIPGLVTVSTDSQETEA